MASSSRAKLLNPTQYHLDQQQQHQHPQQRTFPLSLYDQGFQSPPFGDVGGGASGDPDEYSQTFLSPMAPLDDLDDLDYKSGMYADNHHHNNHNHHNYNAPWQQGPESPPPFPTATTSTTAGPVGVTGGLPPSHFAGPMSAPANILSTTSQLYARHQQHQQQQQQQQPEMAKSLEDDYAIQVNLQMIMEKRRRRRESHNAVERRRRDNINDRIQELGSLLPEAMFDNDNYKPNKGIILRKTVDHIRYLQQEVNAYQQRIQQLEGVLDMFSRPLGQYQHQEHLQQ